MSEPLEQLQFTEEEIDHGVHALLKLREKAKRDPFGAGGEPVAEVVRTVLRAVRAVPARCLNGHLAGEPAAVGTKVRGTGLGGAWIQGTVLESYPVTTIVRAPDGRTDYLWTNTIRSWDPSTEKAPPAPAEYDHPIGVNMTTGRIVFASELHDPALVADDDGMAVERER